MEVEPFTNNELIEQDTLRTIVRSQEYKKYSQWTNNVTCIEIVFTCIFVCGI